MKCHYEILEVPRDADDSTIKKSYRRLALLWHPDKNTDRVDECTRQFTLLQQAYEVLSDRQERAWYDRHREQILRGGVDEHYQDRSLNLFPYFSSSCYVGFNDDEKGFYRVYRHVFETLANEDLDFVESPEDCAYPTFGQSDSSYEEVVGPFYAFWSSYSTRRTFSWLDKFDIREKVNRATLRAMEKENAKLRDAGRKERNEEIRELVSFVRKRDPRVAAQRQLLEEKRVQQERKTEERRKAQIRERLADLAIYVEDDAIRTTHENALEEIEQTIAAEFGHSTSDSDRESSDGDNHRQQLYCIVCEKNFKNPQQLANHNKSKKHRDAFAELKQHMRDDDLVLLDGDDEHESHTSVPQMPGQSSGKMADDEPARKSKRQKRRQRQRSREREEDEDADDEAVSATAREEVESIAKSETSANVPAESANDVDATRSSPVDVPQQSFGKKGKVKTRPNTTSSHSFSPVIDEPVDPTTQSKPKPGRCDTCKMVFESRTQLFLHLKEAGHATVKGQQPASAEQGKKNRKKK